MDLALDEVDGAVPPVEWLISTVCEAFQVPPSVAKAELTANPRLVLDILDLRRYAQAKADVAAADENAKISQWALTWVMDVHEEIVRRRKAQRERDGD